MKIQECQEVIRVVMPVPVSPPWLLEAFGERRICNSFLLLIFAHFLGQREIFTQCPLYPAFALLRNQKLHRDSSLPSPRELTVRATQGADAHHPAHFLNLDVPSSGVRTGVITRVTLQSRMLVRGAGDTIHSKGRTHKQA